MNGTAPTSHPTFFYAPATDTVELPRLLRGAPQPTAELHLLDLAPVVPIAARRSLVARTAVRVRRSAFVRRDLPKATTSALATVGVLAGGVAMAVFVIATYRGGQLLHLASIGGLQ